MVLSLLLPWRLSSVPQNSCKDVVSLEGADTEGGAMSRLIFAESTGYEEMSNTLYRSAGSDTNNIDINTPYFNERYAVAASVHNRVNYLAGIQTQRDPLRMGSPGASAIDVIYSAGDVATTQYQGFTTSSKGALTISGAVQGRITRALNSPANSSSCYDLQNAVTVAKGAHYDPFGGRTFGLFSGRGSPGKAYYSLPAIPGSSNRFYGLNH